MTASETDFYAAFLHELNQPLTAIHNLLELTTFRESNDWPAVVEDSLANLDRMIELIDLMSQLKRLERSPLPKEQADIAEVLREALEDLGASATADDKQLVGEGTAEVTWVMMPLEVLRPALFRILDDAVHHTPRQEVIRIALCPGPAAVSLEIASAGMRFSPHESQTVLSLAHTGQGPRGAITRRVFRMALTLRTLALHGATFALSHDESQAPRLRIALPR
jgi:signal transduction histidine kinase